MMDEESFRKFIQKLGPKQRAFFLNYFNGVTRTEIAGSEGKSKTTIGMHIKRATGQLFRYVAQTLKEKGYSVDEIYDQLRNISEDDINTDMVDFIEKKISQTRRNKRMIETSTDKSSLLSVISQSTNDSLVELAINRFLSLHHPEAQTTANHDVYKSLSQSPDEAMKLRYIRHEIDAVDDLFLFLNTTSIETIRAVLYRLHSLDSASIQRAYKILANSTDPRISEIMKTASSLDDGTIYNKLRKLKGT
jgi:predicted DNA-binding protein YlxM (UPF0122 family)